MFEGSTYESGLARLEPGDALVMYSDGITEAEDPAGEPFDEAGLVRTLALYPGTLPEATAASVGQAIFDAVERHRRDSRLGRRPVGAGAEPAQIASQSPLARVNRRSGIR